MKKLSLAILVSSLLFSVVEAASLEVYGLKKLLNLPSASAHFFEKGILYAVGDDSPSLYSLDSDFSIIDKININNGQVKADGRVPGNQKADLEACDLLDINNSSVLVMLGSGTRANTRERALLYSLDSKTIRWKNIKPFYRYLRKVAGLNDNEFINIEGLASTDEMVYLLSRGSHGPNIIFSIAKTEFVGYLSGNNEYIKGITAHRVKLPSINNVQATLSGASFHLPTQSLFITASVDGHDNGGILGSFMTSMPIAKLAKDQPIDLIANSLLLKHNGKPLKSKVESVALLDDKDAKITGLLAADNDDGISQFMHFEL